MLNQPFTKRLESSDRNRSPVAAMLDVAFWWCVAVALTGSVGLIGLALFAGRAHRSQPRGLRLARSEPLVLRHFGRA
ncbi:hypothetical protein SAMN02799622_04639 [Methylobacterium sp. UNC378MF]|nr:hypothetical protein SAMN02799622_04639 [Methylobacterium sp. UNC378MF]